MWKPLFGRSDLGDHLVVDGLILDIPVKAFGGFKTLVEAIAESDVVSNVTMITHYARCASTNTTPH